MSKKIELKQPKIDLRKQLDLKKKVKSEKVEFIGQSINIEEFLKKDAQNRKQRTGPKVLILDIETAPIVAHVWGLWENNVGLNQIQSDWHLLSWAAKWLGSSSNEIMYRDQRNVKDISDDSAILKEIWKLMDVADIILTQNGKSFDIKKLNARFIINKLPPPSSYQQIDTKRIASQKFGFTSNKLEYLTDKLCVKYKKQKHKKFPGHELWTECLKGNIEAWKEMERYNKFDVLSLEELYIKLMAWDNSINFNVYNDEEYNICKCGGNEFIKKGFHYSNVGKYQRYKCKRCGSELKDKNNLLGKEKKEILKNIIK